MDCCKQCGKPLTHFSGRKKKQFCDTNCRNKWFYTERKKLLKMASDALVDLPEDYAEVNKVGILTKEGNIKPLVFKKPPKKVKKAANQDKLKETIEYTTPTEKDYDGAKTPLPPDEHVTETHKYDWEIALENLRNNKTKK